MKCSSPSCEQEGAESYQRLDTLSDIKKLAMEKVSQELEMAEHVACQLDWD